MMNNEHDSAVSDRQSEKILSQSQGFHGLIIIAIALVAVIVASWFVINYLENNTRKDIASKLRSDLASTSQGMSDWINDLVSVVKIWSTSDELTDLTAKLIEVKDDREALLSSSYLKRLREIYNRSYRSMGYLGFFLITPDGVSIASSRDSNVGTVNLMIRRNEFFNKVFSGKPGFTLPMISDVPLPDKNGNLVDNYPTMFVASPIINSSGQVIAMLTLRVNPTERFTHQAQIGNFGDSGESYAYDADGVMMTESRFEDQLRNAGLIKPGQQSILSLSVRDPGGDLLHGFIPSVAREDQPLTFDVRQALEGKTGIDLDGFRDYRGVDVIGAWTWLENLGFGLTTKIDRDEAYSSFRHTRATIIIVLLITVGIFLGLSIQLVRSRERVINLASNAIADEEKISAVIDSAIDGVITTKSDGEIEIFNPAAQVMFGYTTEEISNKNVNVLIPVLDNIRHDGYIKQFVQTGSKNIIGKKLEAEGHKKDGTLFPVELAINEFHYGDELKYVGIVRDLTRRKLAEVKLRESQRYLNEVLNAATQVAIIATDQEGTITVWNTGAETMLGYAAEETVGKVTPAIIHLESEVVERGNILSQQLGYPVQGFDVFVARAKLGEYEKSEWTYVKKDQTQIKVDLIVTAVHNSNGDIAGYLGVAIDITDRKQAERLLKKAKQEADNANQAKSEFLAQMSHEIRTPINIVIGMAELIMDTRLNPEQANYLGMIRESANSLLQIINDILDFSKIEAGKLEIEAVEFRLRDNLCASLHSMALQAQKKGLEMACQIHPDVPDGLVGDAGRLRQILINLASNAIKFTEEGEILVHVELVSSSDKEVTLKFSVRDTGIGIEPEKQGKIFGAFEQSDSFTTRKYGGTGLGLAISTKLVNLMDGKIWLESEPGKGSNFQFTVKLGIDTDSRGREFPEEIKELEELRVLLVVGKIFASHVLEEMLTSWMMVTTNVSSEKEALSQMEEKQNTEKPYQLIIIDADLLETDGFLLAEKIKQNDKWSTTPVIMLTQSIRPNDVPRCVKLGIETYTNKPVMESDLMNTIFKAMGLFTIDNQAIDQSTGTGTIEFDRQLNILVADDNLGNQLLVERLLDKWGHRSVVVDDGTEVLDVLDKEEFDLILMDINMPEMNGFVTTSIIRKKENELSQPRIPIIALTAHALKGDRENCLKAGMDAYVSKPIQRNILKETIKKVTSLPESDVPEIVGGNNKDIFDRDAYIERLEGDTELTAELVKMFLLESPKLVADLKDTVLGRDSSQIEHRAHEIKGWVGNLSADKCFKTAQSLESMGNSGNLDRVDELYEILVTEIDNLKKELNKFLEEQKS